MSWNDVMAEAAARDKAAKDAKPAGPATRTLYQKEELTYQHPAAGENTCRICACFRRPHSCTTVIGWIRAEDWCSRFQEK